MSGKGSAPRPFSVSQDEYSNNFDKIFRKPNPKEVEDAQAEDEEFKRSENQFDKSIMTNEYQDVLSTEDALEALVEENQRLGFYDDWKP